MVRTEGKPVEPGKPGEAGRFGGGRGGYGGAGGRGADLPQHGWREWVIAGLITVFLISLGYAALFHVRDEALQACRDHNEAIMEVNERAAPINHLIFHERKRHPEGHGGRKRTISHWDSLLATKVPLTDCEVTHDKPWPF